MLRTHVRWAASRRKDEMQEVCIRIEAVPLREAYVSSTFLFPFPAYQISLLPHKNKR